MKPRISHCVVVTSHVAFQTEAFLQKGDVTSAIHVQLEPVKTSIFSDHFMDSRIIGNFAVNNAASMRNAVYIV